MGRIACRCCRDGLGADIRHAAIGRGWRAGLAGLCLGPGAKPQEQAARDAAHWFSMARPGLSSLRAVTVGALGLGALHALTMGCLASLMLAMVTRVSCGHSGRALVADRTAWTLFWMLQVATVLRIAAAVPGVFGVAWVSLLPLAACLWAATMGVWGVRLGRWYGCLRADGRPG